MRIGSDGPRAAPLATAGALAAAAAAALLLAVLAGRRRSSHLRGCGGEADAEREKLVAILAELSRRFFHVCSDVASIARSVRAKIETSSVAVSEETLQAQLSRQCKVFERLEEIEAEVARQFDCTPKDVRVMQQRAARDALVHSYEEGFRTMLTDALDGTPPVLPNVKIPEVLTEEKVLEIQAEVHATETELVLLSIGSGKRTLKEFGEVLSAANRAAWDQTLEAHKSVLQGGPEVFHSALAIYMRNEDFAKERMKLDEVHQRMMVKLFQSDGKP